MHYAGEFLAFIAVAGSGVIYGTGYAQDVDTP